MISDKPKDYAYSTAERTDLVEAIWRDFGVRSTTLVAFDFSSLVVLEHPRRRLERAERGEPASGPDIRGVFIFNGGLFTDGHSHHPWYTTPVLRRLPSRARRGLGFGFTVFKIADPIVRHVEGGVVFLLGNLLADLCDTTDDRCSRSRFARRRIPASKLDDEANIKHG